MSLALLLTMGIAAGCTNTGDAGNNGSAGGNTNGGGNSAGGGASAGSNDSGSNGGSADAGSGEIKEFTAFFAVPGSGEIRYGSNTAQELIAEKIGARCKETWLVGQTAEEAVGTLIAGGEYPDFIDGSAGTPQLIDAGALIPIDEYWDGYDNIKATRTEAEWNQIRWSDGHIYIIPQFSNVYMYDTETKHNDEAFWIQTRVLKWAGYPKIETLDEYFDVIERYIEANPTMEDGTPNIGYEILCDDWRYFCIENAPFFLDGHPNDGCIIVDDNTHQAIDYNTTPTAKRYFNKLNEEFHKGIVDPETFTMNYDQYISKLSTGRVCGMVDQYWDFQQAEASITQQGLDDCTYVPVGVTIDKGIRERYHSAAAMDVSNGIGITTSCKDIPGALKFIDDLLSPEILTIRSWGIEGQDYLVGDDGLFYRTEEMREQSKDQAYREANNCNYSYFPSYSGMNMDGKNAYDAAHQPKEFYESLSDEVKECFAAYGVETYVQLLQPSGENQPWYPMWSWSNNLTADTPEGYVWVQMGELKHEWLPRVVMSDNFDSEWDNYMAAYGKLGVETFLEAANAEIQRRIDVANG